MWWLFIVMIGLMLYSKLDDIIEVFKSNDPTYQKKKQAQEREQLTQQLEVARRLEELLGQECQLESSQFYLLSLPGKVQATIHEVSHGWVECTIEQKKPFTLILKIEDISMVSQVI